MHKRANINIRQLETLAAVVHHGTLSKAAGALNISQPALSRTITNLEESLGTELFLREKKRLTLTAEGQIIVDRARELLLDVADLERLAVDLKALRRGRLCVVSISAFANGILSDCVAYLVREGPELEIAVRVQSDSMILEWVATREADLGVTMLDVAHPQVASEPLFDVDAVCVLPKDHPMTKHRVIELDHIMDSRLIRFCKDTKVRQRMDAALQRLSGTEHSTLEVYSSMSACELVARGLGVALVDPFTAIPYAGRHSLEMRPFALSIPYRFFLLRPLQRPPSELAQRMMALLRGRAMAIAEAHELRLRPCDQSEPELSSRSMAGETAP